MPKSPEELIREEIRTLICAAGFWSGLCTQSSIDIPTQRLAL
jgi:hypothetical protein